MAKNRTIDPAVWASVTDDEIAIALQDANIPVLLACIIHLTGDQSWLDGPIRPQVVAAADPQGGLTETERSAVREAAFEALKAYRDRGFTLPSPPSDETTRRMLNFVVGDVLPDEYLPMMLEEISLYGGDARRPEPVSGAGDFHTVVIGAGMSGLLAAIRLRQAGVSVRVLEKNADVGGTWFENRYPGCRVDVPNHFYSYSFEPNHDWPQHYSQRDDLSAYFSRLADEYDLRSVIDFGVEVEAARWDEAAQVWRIDYKLPDGARETIVANAVVAATGQLNRPRIPDIEGLDRFSGRVMHTATWDRDVETQGKRIAVIGTGASGIQLIPELAKTAARLTVFQRQPQWMRPLPTYHDRVAPGHRWLLTHVPFYSSWYRFLLFWPASDGMLKNLRIDPAWADKDRSVSAFNDAARQRFTDYIVGQVGDDPELLAKTLPDYPPFTKRLLMDNGGWFRALKQDNVRLVTDGVARIDEAGVIDGEGERHEADIIVFATGFNANRFLFPMRIEGRNGQSLEDFWAGEARAHLGITVPGFPNFFILYGPGTNIGHGGSVIFVSECQVRYAVNAITTVISQGLGSVDVKPAVYADYARRIEAELAGLVWSSAGATSWYKNAAGKVVTTLPWRFVDYWGWTKTFDTDEYVIGCVLPSPAALAG